MGSIIPVEGGFYFVIGSSLLPLLFGSGPVRRFGPPPPLAPMWGGRAIPQEELVMPSCIIHVCYLWASAALPTFSVMRMVLALLAQGLTLPFIVP